MNKYDFRLFKKDNLPIFDNKLEAELMTKIGGKYYSNKKNRNILKKILISSFGPKCAYCGCELTFETGQQADHFIPHTPSNTDDLHNLVICCCGCNNAKRKAQFDHLLYPYTKEFSDLLKRDDYGRIVPSFPSNESLEKFCEQLHFSSIKHTLSYTVMLIDTLIDNYAVADEVIAKLSKFKISLCKLSSIPCLIEKITS